MGIKNEKAVMDGQAYASYESTKQTQNCVGKGGN
jgi:hypothetical protein